jgi:MFS family permease
MPFLRVWLHGLAAALIATTTAQALATLAVFALPTLAPLVADDLGVAPHLVGYQVALIYVAAASTSLRAGGILARFGPARSTQMALGAAALGAGGIAWGGLAGAAAGSLLLGIGYGLTNPAASQVLNQLAPANRRNMVFSIKQTGVPLGGAAAGLLLPGLSLLMGWRGALSVVALLAALAALAMGLFRPAWDGRAEGAAAPARSGPRGFALLRSRPGLVPLACMGACFSAMQLSLGAYAVTMLVEEFHWSAVAAGGAAAASLIAGAIGRLIWAAVADRIGAGLPVLAVIGLATALAASVMPFALGWPAAVVLVLLCAFGACTAGWTGLSMAEGARLAPPGAAGAATGAILAVTFTGVVVGPSIFALTVSLVGSYAGAFGVLAIVPAIGAGIAWHTHRRLGSPRG